MRPRTGYRAKLSDIVELTAKQRMMGYLVVVINECEIGSSYFVQEMMLELTFKIMTTYFQHGVPVIVDLGFK